MDVHGSAALPSRIASLVHAHFDALPQRSKPAVRPDGSREWVPMAGTVVVRGENTPAESLTCVAVTTGAKCLAASHVPRCRGLVLHDCHAEVLAVRAFNYWLLTACRSVLANEQTSTERTKDISSPFVHRRANNTIELETADRGRSSKSVPPFELDPNISIYLYCTCAPCGDASMELCMAAQEDATPWEIPTEHHTAVDAHTGDLLDGRAHFSRLGVVRRKPARTDAESTRSKSCSDKLALRQVSSLLSHQTSLLVAPTKSAYLAGIILPEQELSREGSERSFGDSGRMAPLTGLTWPSRNNVEEEYGYRFRPFKVFSIPMPELETLWTFEKPASQGSISDAGDIPKKSKPSNISAIWVRAPTAPGPESQESGTRVLPYLCGSRTGLYENIINGVRQGSRASAPSPRGASGLCRAKLWGLLRDILPLVNSRSVEEVKDSGVGPDRFFHDVQEADDTGGRAIEAPTYYEFKQASPWARRNAIHDARRVLKGWIRNSGDEDWRLDVLDDSKKRTREESPGRCINIKKSVRHTASMTQ